VIDLGIGLSARIDRLDILVASPDAIVSARTIALG
jgi:hypothetical protein